MGAADGDVKLATASVLILKQKEKYSRGERPSVMTRESFKLGEDPGPNAPKVE